MIDLERLAQHTLLQSYKYDAHTLRIMIYDACFHKFVLHSPKIMMDAFLNLHSLLKYDAGTPKTMMHALLNLHALLKSMMHSLITFMIIQSKVTYH